jgi:hypothetical protein
MQSAFLSNLPGANISLDTSAMPRSLVTQRTDAQHAERQFCDHPRHPATYGRWPTLIGVAKLLQAAFPAHLAFSHLDGP